MTVRKIRDSMSASLERIQQRLDLLPAQAYKYWVSVTPVRTGNARRKTKLRGDTIDANYQYAVPLDQGWSRQAPEGMSKPTENYIKREMRSTLRK